METFFGKEMYRKFTIVCEAQVNRNIFKPNGCGNN